MNIKGYRKTIFSSRMFSRAAGEFFAAAGILAVLLDIITIQFPNSFSYGWPGLLITLVLGIAVALFRAFPRQSFSVAFSQPDMKITMRVGDLFQQDGHLVIGFCDTFDTEIGNIISSSSVQGQFLMKIYDNNRTRLDHDLDAALPTENFQVDPTRLSGKNKRYPIGTTAVLSGQGRKFFCCAYSKMGDSFKVSSGINNLWDALQNLWQKIRVEGEQKSIIIPVIGSNLARVPGVSHSLLIKLIILSYVVNSRMEPIAKELKVVIHNADAEKVNFLEIKDFINSL